jgi:hypothetical protein
LPDAPPWLGEILVNVCAQGLERRDVDDAHLIWERSTEALTEQLIDGGQKRGEGLARTGWCGDERVSPIAGGSLAFRLCLSRRPQGLTEPLRNDRMKSVERHCLLPEFWLWCVMPAWPTPARVVASILAHVHSKSAGRPAVRTPTSLRRRAVERRAAVRTA